jgi:hypothetical protein
MMPVQQQSECALHLGTDIRECRDVHPGRSGGRTNAAWDLALQTVDEAARQLAARAAGESRDPQVHGSAAQKRLDQGSVHADEIVGPIVVNAGEEQGALLVMDGLGGLRGHGGRVPETRALERGDELLETRKELQGVTAVRGETGYAGHRRSHQPGVAQITKRAEHGVQGTGMLEEVSLQRRALGADSPPQRLAEPREGEVAGNRAPGVRKHGSRQRLMVLEVNASKRSERCRKDLAEVVQQPPGRRQDQKRPERVVLLDAGDLATQFRLKAPRISGESD